MKIATFAAIVLAGCPLATALAQDPAAPPSYRWVEAGYGSQHLAGPGDYGTTAPDAFRVAGSVELVPHLYLLGSYTRAKHPAVRVDTISAGIGAHAPLLENLHGVLQLTYDSSQTEIDSIAPDFEEDGFGLETGVRWFASGAELDLTAEYTVLEGRYQGASGRDHFPGYNIAAIVPITGAVALTIRMERLFGSGDINDEVDIDTYLAGVRLNF